MYYNINCTLSQCILMPLGYSLEIPIIVMEWETEFYVTLGW